jgi:hypothetical protein
VDEAFRRWAEKRDRAFQEWSENRDRRFHEWSENRDRRFHNWTEKRDREMREFLDALTERHVGITQQMIGAITKLQAEIADQRAQIQANTRAVLRLLDRFGPA